jgi:hypothetical protein
MACFLLMNSKRHTVNEFCFSSQGHNAQHVLARELAGLIKEADDG